MYRRPPSGARMRDGERCAGPSAPASSRPPYVRGTPPSASPRPRTPARVGHEQGRPPPGEPRCSSRSQNRIRPRAGRSGGSRFWPTHGPQDGADGLLNRSLSREKPVTQSSVTGDGLAAKALERLGVRPEVVRKQVEQIFARRNFQPTASHARAVTSNASASAGSIRPSGRTSITTPVPPSSLAKKSGACRLLRRPSF